MFAFVYRTLEVWLNFLMPIVFQSFNNNNFAIVWMRVCMIFCMRFGGVKDLASKEEFLFKLFFGGALGLFIWSW